MRFYQIILLVLISSFLLSCDGGDDGISNSGCSIEQRNHFVHQLLLEKYLWYQEVEPTVDYADFNSPSQILDYLKYHELDRFSYITSAEVFDSLYNAGQYLGYGFSYTVENDDRVWIRFGYDDSPAGRAGLQRGDELLSINGQTVGEIINALAWDGIFGPAEEGYPLELLVRKPDTSIVTLNLEKAVVNINTVLHHQVIRQGAETLGYLVFNGFLSTSRDELETVFSDFAAAGVEKLILDLRYNGGGSVAVARDLASYLSTVNEDSSHVFTHLVYNDKNQSSNRSYYLAPMINSLNLDQLVVLTTGATCSASEMIINGLDPYLEVRTIGARTCGKPVGMNAYEFCENVLLPVTFRSENRDGESYSFDGLTVDCPSLDDVSYAFGETAEPMLAEALYVIGNDSCSPLSSRAMLAEKPQKPQFSPGSLRAVIGAY